MANARDPTVIRQVPGKTNSLNFTLLKLYALTHSNIFYLYRRTYRYNDRASPAEVASETSKPQNLSMNIRSKAVSSPVSKQPTAVQQKKINLGAAANFGKTPNAAGIHSPTHRDTPSTTSNNTVDLMGGASPTNNNNNNSSKNKSNNTSSNNNDLLDDLFKTCAPTPEKTLNSAAVIVDDDDDFNPRAGDAAPATQEFGDFAAAFGGADAGGPSAPSTGILPAATTADNDEFADFAAFESSSSTALADQLVPTPASDSFDLFNSPATPAAAPTATDLLAGLGDLSIHQSMPMGKHT